MQNELVHPNPKGQASLVSMQMCCVCFTEFSSLSTTVKLPCGHNNACSNCWRQFILAKLEDGHGAHLQCMTQGCHMLVPLSEAQKVLTEERCAATPCRALEGSCELACDERLAVPLHTHSRSPRRALTAA